MAREKIIRYKLEVEEYQQRDGEDEDSQRRLIHVRMHGTLVDPDC